MAQLLSTVFETKNKFLPGVLMEETLYVQCTEKNHMSSGHAF